MLLGYVKYFNDDIRYKVRNFINHINYPNLKYNWSERVNLKKNIEYKWKSCVRKLH